MKAMRKTIRLGTHGEQYGNWMPVSMLSLMGGLLALAAALAVLCFAAFHWNVLGVLFTLGALALAAALCWFAWMRGNLPLGTAASWNKSIRRFSPIWISTARDKFWMWAAALARCPSVPP